MTKNTKITSPSEVAKQIPIFVLPGQIMCVEVNNLSGKKLIAPNLTTVAFLAKLSSLADALL